jgi:hypothetical protein
MHSGEFLAQRGKNYATQAKQIVNYTTNSGRFIAQRA